MDEKKENEEIRDDEVNRAGGLMTTEDIYECGDNGCDGGRHGEAGDNSQREQRENDGEVGEPLEDVVRAGLFFAGALPAQMIRNDTQDSVRAKISLRGQQVSAEMMGEEAGYSVKQSV